MSQTAWIGLGGNLGNPVRNLCEAVLALDAHESIDVQRLSRLYRSLPWGVTDQPDFHNAVVAVSTTLAPEPLLSELLSLEAQLGRVRGPARWGPRHIDLDLLMYDGALVDSPQLTLPHPRLSERAFVLVPLMDIAPNLKPPGFASLADALTSLPAGDRDGLTPVADAAWDALMERKQE